MPGLKMILPTVETGAQLLEEEIARDGREAELLIQLRHLSQRVEQQDNALAEIKEENTVLKIQNQNLTEALNRLNASRKTSLFRKNSKEEIVETDDSNDNKRLFLLEQELEDQKEVNKQLKAYVGDVLINIIVQTPHILEKKQ